MGAGWTWNRSPKNAKFSGERSCNLSGRMYTRSMKKHLSWKTGFIALSLLVFSEALSCVCLAVARVFLVVADILGNIPDIV